MNAAGTRVKSKEMKKGKNNKISELLLPSNICKRLRIMFSSISLNKNIFMAFKLTHILF